MKALGQSVRFIPHSIKENTIDRIFLELARG